MLTLLYAAQWAPPWRNENVYLLHSLHPNCWIKVPSFVLLFLRLFSCSVHVKFATPLSTHPDLQHSFLACFKSLLPYYQKYLKILLFIHTHTHKYIIYKKTGSCHSSISFIYEVSHYAVFPFENMTNLFL